MMNHPNTSFSALSGVADQLQSNYAGDLRNILKAVFEMHCSELLILADNARERDSSAQESSIPRTSNIGSRQSGHISGYTHQGRSIPRRSEGNTLIYIWQELGRVRNDYCRGMGTKLGVFGRDYKARSCLSVLYTRHIEEPDGFIEKRVGYCIWIHLYLPLFFFSRIVYSH